MYTGSHIWAPGHAKMHQIPAPGHILASGCHTQIPGSKSRKKHASIVGLIGSTISVIQQIRNARNRVKGASETIDSLSNQLDNLNRSLILVRDEKALQTAAVGQQVRAITEVAEELRSFLDALAAEQQKRSISQLIHSLKSGDKDDKQLAGILDRLDRGRNTLVLQISVAQVGVMGNLEEGFYVAVDILKDTNNKVNAVLGTNLVLAERLQNRGLQQTGGTISLDASDLKIVGPVDQSRDTTPGRAAPAGNETLIYDNVTVGQARIMTGNVGVENWLRVAGRKTSIARNKFEQDVQIMTGDLGGEAAKSFNECFWK
ncbi:uncharacterized protein B0T15DRAFT_578059 [Chaetomium strumarium]|uniref:Uncharacterized protein n=1 Tax=Chaetomium strumarium TaxID=1170767 RepID=A0AAJ0GKW3_9PEZI|nr:hypothetical protein B0T15DRAFT_578059 [Chaetomium strumarium]